MSTGKKTHRQKLCVEKLEPRACLTTYAAGAVTAVLQNGDIFITGDDIPNVFSVESNGAGNVLIQGFNDWRGVATNVNGPANRSLTLSGFTGSLYIDGKGGTDIIRLTNLVVPGSVHLNADWGDDFLITGRDTEGIAQPLIGACPTGPLIIDGNLSINGGSGHDYLSMSDIRVQGTTSIYLNNGNDRLRFTPQTDAPSIGGMIGTTRFLGNTQIEMGNGTDSVEGRGLYIGGKLNLNDAANTLNYSLAAVQVQNNFDITTGHETDNIYLANTRVEQTLNIHTRGGNDNLYIRARAQTMNIDTGFQNDGIIIDAATYAAALNLVLNEGNDYAKLDDITASLLNVQAGNGNDAIDLIDSFCHTAHIHGDAGFDTYKRIRDRYREIRIDDLNLDSLESQSTIVRP